jgi:cell division septation protein DedD
MRSTGALLFVAIGVVLLWMAATGKLSNLTNAWAAIRGQPTSSGTTSATPAAPTSGVSSALGSFNPGDLLSWLPRIGAPPAPSVPSGVTAGGSAVLA